MYIHLHIESGMSYRASEMHYGGDAMAIDACCDSPTHSEGSEIGHAALFSEFCEMEGAPMGEEETSDAQSATARSSDDTQPAQQQRLREISAQDVANLLRNANTLEVETPGSVAISVAVQQQWHRGRAIQIQEFQAQVNRALAGTNRQVGMTEADRATTQRIQDAARRAGLPVPAKVYLVRMTLNGRPAGEGIAVPINAAPM